MSSVKRFLWKRIFCSEANPQGWALIEVIVVFTLVFILSTGLFIYVPTGWQGPVAK